MTKILISPGYGAGWSTWIGDGQNLELLKWVLTYQPLIDFIEQGGKFTADEIRYRFETDHNTPNYSTLHPVLRAFAEEYLRRDPEGSPYLGGAQDLTVVEVDGPFRVDEHDGFESITVMDDLISF